MGGSFLFCLFRVSPHFLSQPIAKWAFAFKQPSSFSLPISVSVKEGLNEQRKCENKRPQKSKQVPVYQRYSRCKSNYYEREDGELLLGIFERLCIPPQSVDQHRDRDGERAFGANQSAIGVRSMFDIP